MIVISPERVATKYLSKGGNKLSSTSVVLRVSDGRIVRVDYLPGAPPEYLQATIRREAAKVILPPTNQ